jgi:hypothetical protein
MSKLFGSKVGEAQSESDGLPLLTELEPQIEAEADRLDSLPLPRLGAEVLTKAFSPDYRPDSGMKEIDAVIDAFLPPHSEWTGSPWKAPQPSDAECRLRDLIREGVQVLEHRGLLMPKGYSTNGNWYHAGYVTTRVARAALADGSVEQTLSAGPPAA